MSKIKKVYLHIGMHKTATSSIQATMYHNKELLRKIEKGILYPNKWGESHCAPMYSIFTENPESYHYHIKNRRTKKEIEIFNKRMKDNIIKEINYTKCETLLISGEEISILSTLAVEKIRVFFNEVLPNVDIKIIISTRESSSFISSTFQQATKGGNSLKTYISRLSRFQSLYYDRIEKFIKFFSKENIIAYKFEDACKHEYGPVGYFLQVLGVKKDEIKNFDIKKTNEGVSDKAVELIAYINDTIPLITLGKLSKGRYGQDTIALHNIRGKKYKLDKTIIQKIEKQNFRDTLWLKDTLDIDYTNYKLESFSEKNHTYNDDYYEDVTMVYSSLSKMIKRLVYEFMVEKSKNIKEQESQVIINRIIEYIQQNHPEIINTKLNDLIDEYEYKISCDKEHKEMLLNKFQIETKMHNADFYRDIAVFLEKHGQLESAYYFMKKAKFYRRTGPFILKKCNEYEKILQNRI